MTANTLTLHGGVQLALHRWREFETSLPPDVAYVQPPGHVETVINGWRFTCAKWPPPHVVQGRVQLVDAGHGENSRLEAGPTAVLGSLLTDANDPKPTRQLWQEKLNEPIVLNISYHFVKVSFLNEEPSSFGVTAQTYGIRVHFRGYWRSE